MRFLLLLLLLLCSPLYAATLQYEETFEDGQWTDSLASNFSSANGTATIDSTKKFAGTYSVRINLTRTSGADYRAELIPKNSKNIFKFDTEYWLGMKINFGAYVDDTLYEINPFQIHNRYVAFDKCQLGDALRTGPFLMTVNGGNQRIYTFGGAYDAYGDPVAGTDHIAWTGTLPKNQWVEMVFHFKISKLGTTGGYIEAWRNGVKLFREDKPLSFAYDFSASRPSAWTNDGRAVPTSPFTNGCGPTPSITARRALVDGPSYQFGIYKAAWKSSVGATSSRAFWVDDIRLASGADGYNLVNGSAPPADTTPPVISSVLASGITNDSATITWTTDEASDSGVDYGATTSYGSTATNATAVTSHSITLTGLASGATFNYRVKSKDAANNQATSGNFTFSTSATDTQPPGISNLQKVVTSTAATITWDLSEAGTCRVKFGSPITTSYFKGDLVTSCSIQVVDLTPGTLYSFKASSADAAGNLGELANQSFTTLTQSSPPTVSGLAITGRTTSTATITWNTDTPLVPSDSRVYYGLSPTMSLLATNASLVTSHSITLTGLTKNKKYYFQVSSTSADGTGYGPKSSFYTKTDSGMVSDDFTSYLNHNLFQNPLVSINVAFLH